LGHGTSFGHHRDFRANLDILGEGGGRPKVVFGRDAQLDRHVRRRFSDRRRGDNHFSIADTGDFHDVVGHSFGLFHRCTGDNDMAGCLVRRVVREVMDHLESGDLDAPEEEEKNDRQHDRHLHGDCARSASAPSTGG
jgi:hypothetical protein